MKVHFCKYYPLPMQDEELYGRQFSRPWVVERGVEYCLWWTPDQGQPNAKWGFPSLTFDETWEYFHNPEIARHPQDLKAKGGRLTLDTKEVWRAGPNEWRYLRKSRYVQEVPKASSKGAWGPP